VFWGGEDRIVVQGTTNTRIGSVSNLRILDVANPSAPVVTLEEEFLGTLTSDVLANRLDEVGLSIDVPSDDVNRSAETVNRLAWLGELLNDEPIPGVDLPALKQTHALQSQAIRHVADDLGISDVDVVLLATESTARATNILVKANDRRFAYRSVDGETISRLDWQ
jgi:hypothetical protein